MCLLILGAGRVGESVAESLVSEQNDITVMDTDLCMACAATDETPLAAGKVAHSVFKIQLKGVSLAPLAGLRAGLLARWLRRSSCSCSPAWRPVPARPARAASWCACCCSVNNLVPGLSTFQLWVGTLAGRLGMLSFRVWFRFEFWRK